VKKNIIHFLILITLVLFGLYNRLLYLKNEESGLLNLNIRGSFSNITASTSGELLAGDTVTGIFHSKYPNLGIISIRFFNMNRDSRDTLLFRVKEEGQSKWFYEALYKTDQFQPHKLFPFGFPVIKDSAGRYYIFEIKSLYGETGDGILVDYQTPVFMARSQFTKRELTDDNKTMRYFIFNKIINIFSGSEVISNSIFYFLPSLLYIVYLCTVGISYQFLSLLTMSMVFYDIFYLKKQIFINYIATMLLWFLASLRFKISFKVSIFISIGILILIPASLTIDSNIYTEKTAIWVNLFLLSAILQHIFEVLRKDKDTLSAKQFFKNILNIKFEPIFVAPKKRSPVAKFVFFILSTVLLGLAFFNIFNKLPMFKSFYPKHYVVVFTSHLVLPQIILILSLFVLFLATKKYFKNVFFAGMVLSLIFFIGSRKIVKNSLWFEKSSRIISVTPSKISEAWTDVVITGKNFRNIPFVGKIQIDGTEQGQYMVYWSDEKIVFRTSPDLTRSGDVQVIPLNRTPSNKVPFVYSYK